MRQISLQEAKMRFRHAFRLLSVVTIALLVLAGSVTAQAKRYPLDSTTGLRLHNVVAEPAVLQGKKGVRIRHSEEALRRLEKISGDEQARFPQLATIEGVEFSNGVIEAEIAGTPPPGEGGARGFVGIAFRVSNDVAVYDAFYLRPTNGRADDQERRNHAVQYISHPDWPWFRLRKENPEKYESYVDLLPGVWTKVKIDVRGDRARLYVHDQEQPTLIVNDVKTGAQGRGGVGLWIDRGTVAHFRNLTVESAKNGSK
jgi:hypothetical protein